MKFTKPFIAIALIAIIAVVFSASAHDNGTHHHHPGEKHDHGHDQSVHAHDHSVHENHDHSDGKEHDHVHHHGQDVHSHKHTSHDHFHDDYGHGEAKELVTPDISYAQAHIILDTAEQKAEEIKTKMNIAIVDAGGNLKAFGRMDGAWRGSIDIAIKKAKTSRYFDMPTGTIGKLSQPGGPLYNIEHSNDGLITFPGGVPIYNKAGIIIGAIGVSGSTVENDHTVAIAGAKSILK